MATIIQHPEDQIDGEVDLLIGSDVPEVLEPKEIKMKSRWKSICNENHFWLGHQRSTRKIKYTTSCSAVNFVKAADVNLDKQFQNTSAT